MPPPPPLLPVVTPLQRVCLTSRNGKLLWKGGLLPFGEKHTYSASRQRHLARQRYRTTYDKEEDDTTMLLWRRRSVTDALNEHKTSVYIFILYIELDLTENNRCSNRCNRFVGRGSPITLSHACFVPLSAYTCVSICRYG